MSEYVSPSFDSIYRELEKIDELLEEMEKEAVIRDDDNGFATIFFEVGGEPDYSRPMYCAEDVAEALCDEVRNGNVEANDRIIELFEEFGCTL